MPRPVGVLLRDRTEGGRCDPSATSILSPTPSADTVSRHKSELVWTIALATVYAGLSDGLHGVQARRQRCLANKPACLLRAHGRATEHQ